MKLAGTILLCLTLAALLRASPVSPAVNPHYGAIVCTACHLAADNLKLYSDDFTELCNRCHLDGFLARNHHPLSSVPASMTPPSGWPLMNGALTCLTCHLSSHEEHIGTFMFLRGPAAVRREDFCFLCHSRDSYRDRNPHAEINEGRGCSLCHLADPVPEQDTLQSVTFCGNPDVLCRRCHSIEPHPAGYEHGLVLDQQMASRIAKDIPLYRGNTIVCSTCHNPHIYESVNAKLRIAVFMTRACPGCHRQ